MQRRLISRGRSPSSLNLAVQLLSGVGGPDFADALLASLQPVLPASHCGVFLLDASGEMTALAQASVYGDAAAVTAQAYLSQGFYLRDANIRWLAARKMRAAPVAWLLHQQTEQIADDTYREVCFLRNGIRERLGYLMLQPDGRRFVVSLYRNHSLPAFSPADLVHAEELLPLIEAALLAHLRITRGTLGGRGSPIDDQLHQLSGRERQVISWVLAGHTTKEIARQLGLSDTTVLTYRYRAFRALGIRTQRELMAMLRAPVGD